jgi:NTP pyrophosphatase (non-canonical NTP hydrolase)
MDFDHLRAFLKGEHSRLLKLYDLKERNHLRHLICLKIGEEFGELMEEVLSLEKIQRKEKLDGWEDKTGDEIADVIITILLLAENLGIDIEKELEKGIKKREKRKY